jgi:hypothetical protein
MIKSRFILIIAIAISSWGVGNQMVPTARAIAQNAPATPAPSNYDRLMKAGYEANATRDYPKALQNFQQALQERPNDPYATSAVANIQRYLQGKNPATSSLDLNSLPLPLIIGSILLIIALAGALLSLQSQSSVKPKKKGKKNVKRIPNEAVNPTFTSPNGTAEGTFGNFTPEADPERETLPVQATSRIPNVDLVMRLIDSLRDEDPRTRRRAIWKLAQMSDSRSMQPLVEGMVDGDSYERSLVLEALAQICTRSLRPMNQALAISLQDKNPQVRKNAIRDLTRLYDVMSQISQLICHAMDDPDDEVKETAQWAIRQLNLQLPPRLDIEPLETTGEPEDEVPETPYTESTEVQN